MAMAILGLKVDNVKIEKWQNGLFPVRFKQTLGCSQAETFSVKCICIVCDNTIFVGATYLTFRALKRCDILHEAMI